MRYSRFLIPTVKEAPAEAEIASHQLMIRAGYIRKVAGGAYAYLPLGRRSLAKITGIVRAEMDAAAAQEILLPALQPLELWQRTGRDAAYGPTMCRFTDRQGRQNVLAPTAEEVVTHVAAAVIHSYRQLPINVYQISPKFRDEVRPRFGVLRSREFLMKDAYSFHATAESLEETYQQMIRTYRRIFDRCGVPTMIVDAESGEMGGAGSRQFTVPCEVGEDVIVHTEDGSYAANLEKAAVDPPDAGPKAVSAPGMEEVHTPAAGTIDEVCALLDAEPGDMIKTLIFSSDRGTVVGLVRGDHELNVEKLTQATGCGHVELADAETITRLSGAEVGFAGPMGMTESADKVIIDAVVAAMPVGVAGANRTDYHVRNVVPGRDFPLEAGNVQVADIRNAAEGDTYHGRTLCFRRGIEVGQVFKLGTKYSRALGATFLDQGGRDQPCLMGCYGIGINRILAAAIEVGHDENGCVLPASIAPFEAEVLVVNNNDETVTAAAERIYGQLQAAGVDVLLDDRDVRAGVKFKDADLIGIPLRVVVGARRLKDGCVEIQRRGDAEPLAAPVGDAAARVRTILNEMTAT